MIVVVVVVVVVVVMIMMTIGAPGFAPRPRLLGRSGRRALRAAPGIINKYSYS